LSQYPLRQTRLVEGAAGAGHLAVATGSCSEARWVSLKHKKKRFQIRSLCYT
jgi:hypothetical protein